MIESSKFKVIVECASLSNSKAGSITGIIYILIGDNPFPEKEWSDFPLVILKWWLDAITKLEKHHNGVQELLFMDGPLRVKMIAVDKETIRFECMRDSQNLVEYFSLASIEAVKSEIKLAVKKILNQCEFNAWHSKDISELRRVFEDV